MNKTTKKREAFTLIELLLSIAIITIIFGLSVPFYQTFQVNSAFNTAISDIRQNLFRAQARARNCEEDSRWGLRIENNKIYIYKGEKFADRNKEFDEITTIPTTIAIGGTPDINFDKLNGIPNHPLKITVSSTTNKTSTISINSQGGID